MFVSLHKGHNNQITQKYRDILKMTEIQKFGESEINTDDYWVILRMRSETMEILPTLKGYL